MHSSLQKIVLLLTLVLVLTGCPLITGPPDEKEALATAQGTGGWNGGEGGEDGGGGGAVDLPPSDVVRDSFRVYSSDFKFETLLPVELDLTVRSNAKNEEGFYPPLSDIVVTLMDKEGTILFRGLTDADGLLGSTVMMPSAPKDLILELAVSGRAVKSIEIPDAVERSTIDRIIYLDSEAADGLTASATAPDRDGDGVVDAYDAFPDDPNRAFSYDSSLLTVAFEDLYLQASAGDADYNDFTGQYQVTIETNESGLVTGLTGEAYAKDKIAGYNHDFGIFIEFNGTGDLSYSQINSSGTTIREVTDQRVEDGQAYILLFESTKDSIGHTATFDLDFDVPIALEDVDRAPFDPFLYVRNTRYDIHLIGEDPLPAPYSRRTGTGDFQDAEGFPWALLVPGDWINPGEGVRIETVYPAFDYWRSSFGEDYPDWYKFDPGVDPGPPVDDPVVYVAGYYNDGSKDVAAYWTDDGGNIARHNLYPSALSEATDIAVGSDGTVYASGYYRSGSADTPVLWIDPPDSPASTIELGSAGQATGLSLSGSSDIYVSGYYNDGTKNVAAYWVLNGSRVSEEVVLRDSTESRATDIDIASDGTLHFSGYYRDGSNDLAASWRVVGSVVSEESLYLSDYSLANAIYVDTTVLSAGQIVDGNARPAYWNGGASGLVALNGFLGAARDILSHNSSVYVVGDYLNSEFIRRAAIWTSADPQDLFSSSAEIPTFAYGVAIADENVYVAGTHDVGDEEAVYWVNQNIVPLSSGTRSKAEAIVVD